MAPDAGCPPTHPWGLLPEWMPAGGSLSGRPVMAKTVPSQVSSVPPKRMVTVAALAVAVENHRRSRVCL